MALHRAVHRNPPNYLTFNADSRMLPSDTWRVCGSPEHLHVP